MRIIGIGLDATEVPRIAAALERHGDRFLQRVFSDAEITYCLGHRNPAPSLAARFAAKEAAMKALGTGHSMGVAWRDIEVTRHGGPPSLRFHGAAARRLATLGGTRTLVTLTHTEALALAHVVLLAD